MANTMKTATKGCKANQVSNTESVKSQTTKTIGLKADKTPEELAALAAKKLDKDLLRKSNAATLLAKHNLASTAAWCREFKNSLKGIDEALSKRVDTEWSKFFTNFKLSLNYVIVEAKKKDGTPYHKVVNVIWVPKTDKVGLPEYFGKAKVVSYRFNDKQGNGETIDVADSKELEVTRSVKSPVKVLVTDAEGNQFLANKQAPNAEGIMKTVFEDIDKVYVPIEQIDFDFNEIKHAFGTAMLATFGSKVGVAAAK